MTLEEARSLIGYAVIYRPHSAAPAEDGVIVRVGEQYVFVLYRGDSTPKATSPELLELAARETT